MTDSGYTMDPNFKMHTTQKAPNQFFQGAELGTSMADIEKNLQENLEGLRKQVGGDHYNKHKMQPFDIIDEYGLNFYEGNVLKYLLRWRNKNGSEDLLKAKHYLEELIIRVQEGICE